MLGIPTFWREMKRDAVADPLFHQILKVSDVISPWTIGRYHSPETAARYGKQVMEPDIQWAHQHGMDYLPVVFPGFSWHNHMGGTKPINQIPRLKGKFF